MLKFSETSMIFGEDGIRMGTPMPYHEPVGYFVINDVLTYVFSDERCPLYGEEIFEKYWYPNLLNTLKMCAKDFRQKTYEIPLTRRNVWYLAKLFSSNNGFYVGECEEIGSVSVSWKNATFGDAKQCLILTGDTD
jgi:hypothetical protein